MLEEDRLMALKVNKEDKGMSQGNMVTPGKRLFLTKNGKKLVESGHKDAATLFCSEHGSVLRVDYERLGGKKTKDE